MFPSRLFLIYILYSAVSFGLAFWLSKKYSSREPKKNVSNSIILAACMINALYFYFLFMANYNNFLNGALDTATISQNIWKIANGLEAYETVVGAHSLRIHYSLIWYPLALIFKLWPTINWLVLLSTLSVASTGYIIFLMARSVFKSEMLPLAIGISFLFNPYQQMGQMATVHAESFAILLMSLSLLALINNKWIWFGLFTLAAIICKEDIGLYYAGVGLYIWLVKKKTAFGIITSVLTVSYALVVFKFIMPLFGPDTQHIASRFAALGTGSHSDIIQNIIFHPWVLITPLLNWEKLFSLFYLFVQTGFSVFLSGWALVPLALPVWLKSVTNHTGMFHFWDHYSLPILPFLYWTSILGIERFIKIIGHKFHIENEDQRRKIVAGIALFLIIFALLINIERGNNPLGRKFSLSQFKVLDHNKKGLTLIKKIPNDASVVAEEHIAAHLPLRKEIYLINKYDYWLPHQQPKHETDYALFNDMITKRLPYGDKIEATRQWFEQSPDYLLETNDNGWWIYKRKK